MTNEQELTIQILQNEYLCVDRDCGIERSCGKCDLAMPSKEPILKAYKIAIQAIKDLDKMNGIALDLASENDDLIEKLDSIRAEIEQAADKQFEIAMGVADLNERYTHIQMENAYRHSLNIIDKYRTGE